MRSLLGCVLAMLLIATTPVGTGQGVHQGDLLHPVLPHLHFVDGHFVSHAAAEIGGAPTSPQPGPAFGAGSGADAASLGLAISPTVPRQLFILPTHTLAPLGVVRIAVPREFLETPPDPPPQLAA
jgi:hypothetical protein